MFGSKGGKISEYLFGSKGGKKVEKYLKIYVWLKRWKKGGLYIFFYECNII
jgi:hypothetical protein